MAEDEIIKHTKKALTIYQSSGKGLKSKIIEIFIEVLIIIFAVSTSIWLHNWSEGKRDQKEEKEFLSGLKKDLQSDLENISTSKNFYNHTYHGIQYFLKIQNGDAINSDSLNEYSGIFFSSTDLDPHIARYEGLKSSGKFKIIENKTLLNNIINLHEAIFQRIHDLNEKYYRHNEKLEMVIAQNVKLSDSGKILNANLMIHRSDFKILLSISASIIVYNIIPVHEEGIKKCNELISQIDKELLKL